MHFFKASLALATILEVTSGQEYIGFLHEVDQCDRNEGQPLASGQCGYLENMRSISMFTSYAICTVYEDTGCNSEAVNIDTTSGCTTVLGVALAQPPGYPVDAQDTQPFLPGQCGSLASMESIEAWGPGAKCTLYRLALPSIVRSAILFSNPYRTDFAGIMHFIKTSMAIAAVLGAAAAQDVIALLIDVDDCQRNAGRAVLPGGCASLEYMKSIDVVVNEASCTAYEDDDCYGETVDIALNSGCTSLDEYPFKDSKAIICN
ncbi:hypothetical protein O988_06446 [Pseudogymnoascus sp. VKM F-3808]|nr:hypothetical protein O988_06446 [Pseudogymnoascus sp. VKM F-3808]